MTQQGAGSTLRRLLASLTAGSLEQQERLARLEARIESLATEHAETLRELAKSRFEAAEAARRLQDLESELEGPGRRTPGPARVRVSGQKAPAENELAELDVSGAVANSIASLVNVAVEKRQELDRCIASLQANLTELTSEGGRPRPVPLSAIERSSEPRSVDVRVADGDTASLLRLEASLQRLPGVRSVRVKQAGPDEVLFQVELD